jgi:hypothetical protein
MLIQTTAPRIMINTAESPPYVRIHTLRKPGISTGDVLLVVGDRQMEVEPLVSYPIDSQAGFEALDYYLPFWRVFGTNKPTYDEDRILNNIEKEQFCRVDLDEKARERAPTRTKFLVADTDAPQPERKRLTGVELALLGAAGYSIIAKSAYRTEGATYEQRVFNATIHCPVNGGGMIRIAGSPVDIANPTFDPYAPEPVSKQRDLVLLEAFNRTHRQRTQSVEDRRRARIAEAEGNLRAHNEKALEGGSPPALPSGPAPAARGFRIIKRDD